ELSGGLKRRVDIAASLMGAPQVLCLDEPTTGLDPESRRGLWERVRGLADDGLTVILTSQYIEEVDRLADRVLMLRAGRVIRECTPAEMKEVGGEPIAVLGFAGEG